MGWIADLLSEIPSAAHYKIRLEQMEAELVACKTKVGILESKVLAAEEKVRLNEEENKKKLDNSHGVRLEEVKEKILMAVEKNQGATNQQIAQAAGVSETVATFHLEELKKAKMVRDSRIMGSDWSGSAGRTEWSIAQDGRGYLIAHGLVV